MSKSLEEQWSSSERRKRAAKCANPRGFTMKQFCKNIKTRSKKGEKANESDIAEAVFKRLLGEAPKAGVDRAMIDSIYEEGLAQIEQRYNELSAQITPTDLKLAVEDVLRAIMKNTKDNVFMLALGEVGNPGTFMDMYSFIAGNKVVTGPALLKLMKSNIEKNKSFALSPITMGKKKTPEEIVKSFKQRIDDILFILNGLSAIASAKTENDAQIEASAEAPEDAPLGRIAFPTKRQDKPFEPDTKEEQRLYTALSDYFRSNVPLSAKDAGTIRELLSNGWYADVFSEPTGGEVYRGMAVPKSWLLQLLKKKSIPASGEQEISTTVSPKKNVSSWSSDRKTSVYFTSNPAVRTKGADTTVILHALVEENPGSFVEGESGLYDVEGFEEYSGEKEVLGLGPIKIFKVTWSSGDSRSLINQLF